MNARRISIMLLMAAALVPECFCPIPASAQSTKVSPVAPRREQVEAVVKEAYEKYKSGTNGKNADYIPYLAKVDSKLFGIAIVTTDNQVLTMGDVTYSFSIQSISKVYSLALAMEEQGPEKVLAMAVPGSPMTGIQCLTFTWLTFATRVFSGMTSNTNGSWLFPYRRNTLSVFIPHET
jgi:hypothetical protein